MTNDSIKKIVASIGKKSNIYISNLEKEINEVESTILQSIINIFLVRLVASTFLTSKIYQIERELISINPTFLRFQRLVKAQLVYEMLL